MARSCAKIDSPNVPDRAATPASTGTTTSTLSTTLDVVVVTGPTLQTAEPPHPVTNATFEHFLGESFQIDGVQYNLKNLKVDLLRHFCVKNGVKTTAPPP